MANISHKNLPNAQLHECKGASAASAGQVSVANGAGASSYKYINPHGAVSFVNIASPLTITYPSAFTKVQPTTTAAGNSVQFTEANTARLTYTGSDNVVGKVVANLSVDQSIGADRDIEIAIYKNGSIITNSNIITTSPSGMKQLITSVALVSLATNDYLECYIKNRGASGDVKVYTFYLEAIAFRG